MNSLFDFMVISTPLPGIYGCFLEWWYPQSPPQVLIIFSRIFPWLLGKPTIWGNTHMDFITPESIWITTKKKCSWKNILHHLGYAKSWFGPTLKMVWGIPSGFFSGFFSINQIHKKCRRPMGKLFFTSASRRGFGGGCWLSAGFVVLAVGPGGQMGGRRATWPERYFLIPYTEDPCEISRVF